jgi:two-component system NtrC family sensor kinase
MEMKTGDRSVARRWVAGHEYLIPTAILVLGLVSTAIVIWASQIIDRQWASFEYIDALTDIRIRTATFHIWYEEAISRGSTEDIQRVLPDLDGAIRLSGALLSGGESDHGTRLPLVEEPNFRRQAERIATLLGTFREIALKRYANPVSEARSALAEQCDAVYRELQDIAGDAEETAEASLAREYAKTGRLLSVTVLLWISLVAASTALFYNRERQRKRVELALERAYGEMEQKVMSRTTALAEANKQLREEIAERTRAEAHLRDSEEKFRGLSVQFQTLLDAIPDSISLLSRDLKVLWANRSAGVRPSSGAVQHPAGEYCYTRWHNGSAPCDDCPAMKSFATGRPRNALVTTPDGRRWDMQAVPITGEDGVIESVLEVATDITEKIALQTEAMRAAHLASIGELAAGVAHEINNPINGIINYAQILCNKSPAGSREQEIATRILKEGDRIGSIVRALLSFARESGKEEMRPVATEEILADSLALTRSQMTKEGVILRIAMPPHLPEVVVNPRQIQQVFLNILSNARYALNERYHGTHENKVLEIRGEWMALDGRPRVRVTFQDRGIGIPAHVLNRVTEPFFSTKPSGKGTGLGLSISHGILSDHGGRLVIESVEGERTTVSIDLPAKENDRGEDPRHR